MKYTLGRWLFLPISILIQAILYVLYPFAIIAYLVWQLPKYRKRVIYRQPKVPKPHGVSKESLMKLPNRLRDKYFHDVEDNHNLLMHCHLYLDPRYSHLVDDALELTVDDTGAIMRRYPLLTHNKVSNDCHSGWLVTWVLMFKGQERFRRIAMKTSWHFLKHCFGVRDTNDNAISDRDSCGGVNLVGDGWKGLGWPCVGVYFLTGMAQLAVAIKAAPWWQKPFWELIYHLYFWVNCGPWNAIAPNLHEWDNERYFLMHVSMNEIYVLQKLRPWSLWWKISNWWLRKVIHPHGLINPWFEALAYDAGSKIDKEYVEKLTAAMGWSKIFQWQNAPIYDWYFREGPDDYPASRTSIFYLLDRK